MIDELDYEVYFKYHQAIKHLRARELMDLTEVAKQPYRKRPDQEKFTSSLQRDIYREREVLEMTTAEIFSQLRTMDGG